PMASPYSRGHERPPRISRSGLRPSLRKRAASWPLQLFFRDLLAQLLDGRPQDAQDVHLGATDPLGDLALGHVLYEAEAQHRPIPLRDLLEDRGDRLAVLDRVEGEVLLADPIA